MKKKIDIKDIDKIASLARLELSSADKDEAAAYLADILGYVDKLKEVKTDKVEPYAPDAVGLVDLRSDEEKFFDKRDQLVQEENFDKNGYLVTKGILETKNESR